MLTKKKKVIHIQVKSPTVNIPIRQYGIAKVILVGKNNG